MKLLNQEQFAEMQMDLSELLNKIDNLNSNFDRDNLIKEIKSAISDNSIISSLKNEDVALAENLRALKRVNESFIQCSHEKIIKTVIVALSGVIVGSIITSLLWHFLG